MSLSDQEQQRVWIIAQKVMYESPNFDKTLSNMQILCNIYSIGEDIDDEDDIAPKCKEMLIRIKSLRKHEILRKQKDINDIKVDIDDLISDMIHMIDPKNMQEFPIFET